MDYIAASFVQNADNVFAIRRLLETNGYRMGILSKIENNAGLEHIDDIIKASDAIMVARGDLGVEIRPKWCPCGRKRSSASAIWPASLSSRRRRCSKA